MCEQYRNDSHPLSGYEVIAFRDYGTRLTPADTTVSGSDGYYLLDLNPGYYAIRCCRPDRGDVTWFMVRLRESQEPIRLDLPVQQNTEGLVMIDYTQRYRTWWQSDIQMKEGRPERERVDEGAVF